MERGIEHDIKEVERGVEDREEALGLMEPLLIGEGATARTELIDLALELAQLAAGFRKSLPDGIMTALADLVRAMNCYYNNLIEGHDAHPVDIERALRNDYSADPHKRDLQLEAKAHIAVQQRTSSSATENAWGRREVEKWKVDRIEANPLLFYFQCDLRATAVRSATGQG